MKASLFIAGLILISMLTNCSSSKHSIQNTPCDPGFYIWQNTDSIPAFSAKDTTLTVQYTNCLSENIVIDSTVVFVNGLVGSKKSYGNTFSELAMKYIGLAQKNHETTTISVFYHNNTGTELQRGAFGIRFDLQE